MFLHLVFEEERVEWSKFLKWRLAVKHQPGLDVYFRFWAKQVLSIVRWKDGDKAANCWESGGLHALLHCVRISGFWYGQLWLYFFNLSFVLQRLATWVLGTWTVTAVQVEHVNCRNVRFITSCFGTTEADQMSFKLI